MCVTFLLPLGIKGLTFVFSITGTNALATAIEINCTHYSTLLFHPIFVNSSDLLYRQAIRFFWNHYVTNAEKEITSFH